MVEKIFEGKRILIFILILAAFLRFYKLPELMNFGGDVARDYLEARDITLFGKIPLVGSPSSVPWLHQGALFTYILGIVLWVGRYNPLAGGYFVGVLGVLGVLGVFFLGRKLFSEKVGLIAALFYATSPLIIIFDRYPYHQSVISIFTIAFIYSLFLSVKKTKFFILSSFLFGLLMQLELSNLVLLPVLVIIFLLFRKEINFKIISLSIIAFISTWTPKIIYDFSNGFTQTIGFAAWIVHKLLPIKFSGDNPAEVLPFLDRFFAVFRNLTGIIFWENTIVSSGIFLLLTMFILFKFLRVGKGRLRLETGEFLVLMVVMISLLGFILMGSPSGAYVPILFPGIALLFGYFASNFDNKGKWAISILIIILCFYNALFIVKNNYFILTEKDALKNNGVGLAESFSIFNQVSDFMINDAGGEKYNIVTLGSFAEFPSSVDTFDYLNWYKGNGFSIDKVNLKYLIFYNVDREVYNLRKTDIKKEFPFLTIVRQKN